MNISVLRRSRVLCVTICKLIDWVDHRTTGAEVTAIQAATMAASLSAVSFDGVDWVPR
jgi:hypothetical protein